VKGLGLTGPFCEVSAIRRAGYWPSSTPGMAGIIVFSVDFFCFREHLQR
jgi:hypothetical protein